MNEIYEMTKYTFHTTNAHQGYVSIEVEFEARAENMAIQLPRWRPGRYELGNYAKNVKSFRVFDEAGKKVMFVKTSKDTWQLENQVGKRLKVMYSYFADQLNAGSTCIRPDLLYVNPVNCCVYPIGQENDICQVVLNIPAEWQMAGSLDKVGENYQVANFDELADTPFICSSELQHDTYQVGGTLFHIWFNGVTIPDWDRIKKDFKAFTRKQIEKFDGFPVPEYHFLFHILPFKAYHGVEHTKSTVICLGPSYDLYGALYNDLLGVSSHELYHTWNVKTIRPIQMMPYDFTKENYSELGYLCEGVTTYMGDIHLLRSKVFSLEQYLHELTTRLQQHIDNHGRFNYSVGASSWDTWLDGYEPGAPNRKVSIYTEGCLLAFAADVMILKATKGKFGLDEVMRRLYHEFGLKGIGVSTLDYKRLLEEVSGLDFTDYFNDYVFGTRSYEGILMDALEELGIDLIEQPSSIYSHGRLGLKTVIETNRVVVKAIYPGSPADLAGVMFNDVIYGVNGIALNLDIDQWLKYFDDQVKVLQVIRYGRLMELTLPEVNRNFYMTLSLKRVDEPHVGQRQMFNAWSK